MDFFQVDQRYMSNTEPELGLGIVVETSKGRVKIDFPAAGESRLYAANNAPLRRVKFSIGDSILDIEGDSFVVEKVFDNEGLLIYFGKNRVLSEADLGNVALKYGAEERLFLGDVDSPRQFSLRRRSLEFDHRRRISDVNGFLGGRIDLIPHQLFIAHEVSSRFAPRVLLSDEVGLGKTIEACLILHRLLQSGRISRVLILVPDSLIHQWFVELLRRFNLWFNIFDEARSAAAEKGAPEANPFLDDQLILCSTSFLANSEIRTQQAISANWDMLVVDEAHHLEWSVENASPAYKVVELLSQVAEGLLLLTATPEQLGLESHFARLRLIDPVRYSDFENFKNEPPANKELADIVVKLADSEQLDDSEKNVLQQFLGEDNLDFLNLDDEYERNNLIQNLLDQHGPGRVIFRNRRAAMRKFPVRKANLVPINFDQTDSKLRLEVEADLGRENNSSSLIFQYENDLRLDWLLKLLEELSVNGDLGQGEKVLLICNQKGKVLALENAIKSRSKVKLGVFHEDLSLVLRDRNAAYFAEEDGARLLICSEIGSEGRNFQFAHHLVLWDLPTNPELLEQRIGRLDRIGQVSDIQIHVPYFEASPQSALVHWYHEGLNAFEQNIEGGRELRQIFGQRLIEIALHSDLEASRKSLSDLIGESKLYLTALREKLASGRDRLLEMNSFRPAIGEQLVAKIESEDESKDLEGYMTSVFDEFDIEQDDIAARTYFVRAQLGNAQAFPALPDEGTTVTFDRKRALSREEISFLTWDHPMVTGGIDLVLSSGIGSASIGLVRGLGRNTYLLEVLFVLETIGVNSKVADRFLPNTPLRVVVDQIGSDRTTEFSAEEIDQKLRGGDIDDALENEALMEVVLPKMLKAATKIAEEAAESKIAMGLYRMNSKLNHEISRLQTLQKLNNNIRPEEIKRAIDEQNALKNLIMDAKVRLDAVQLILGL